MENYLKYSFWENLVESGYDTAGNYIENVYDEFEEGLEVAEKSAETLYNVAENVTENVIEESKDEVKEFAEETIREIERESRERVSKIVKNAAIITGIGSAAAIGIGLAWNVRNLIVEARK